MAKSRAGLFLGLAVATGVTALILSKPPAAASPATTPDTTGKPPWWPASVPFVKPANWPAGMTWPPDPNAPPPSGWFVPMQTMPASLPPTPAPMMQPPPCQLDANLPSDLVAQVNAILSMPEQTDANSYDTLSQLLMTGGFPMAAACIQRRKNAGGPIQAPTL